MHYSFVYLLVFKFGLGNVNSVEECQSQGLCENGGTCILNTDLPDTKNCDDDEVYHMGYCYSFNTQPMKWIDAARYCNNQAKGLALTQSSDDQTFYAGYIYGSLFASKALGRGVTGVWTSLRSVSNGSELVWMNFPGSYIVRQHYWKTGVLNAYQNYHDVCVSLQEDTMYRNWMPQSCNALNYVVCKRKAIDQALSASRLSQCLCHPNFGGVRCEKRIVNSAATSAQNISCSSTPFHFRCFDGGTIHVEFASFGASEGYACSQIMTSWRQTCSNPNSLKTIINKCDGLPYCSIQNLSELFSETPCPIRNELYLQYRFTCCEKTPPKCSPGFLYIVGRCIMIDTEQKRLSHTAAKQACRGQGGYLVSNFEQSMESDLSRQVVRSGKENDAFWIDLRIDSNGQAMWSDGNRVTYRPNASAISVPNSCVAYVISGGMTGWKSLPCDKPANYLCAFPPLEDDRRREYVTPLPIEGRKMFLDGIRL